MSGAIGTSAVSAILLLLLKLSGWTCQSSTNGEHKRRQTLHQAPLIRNWHWRKKKTKKQKKLFWVFWKFYQKPAFSDIWSVWTAFVVVWFLQVIYYEGAGAEGLVPLIHFIRIKEMLGLYLSGTPQTVTSSKKAWIYHKCRCISSISRVSQKIQNKITQVLFNGTAAGSIGSVLRLGFISPSFLSLSFYISNVNIFI